MAARSGPKKQNRATRHEQRFVGQVRQSERFESNVIFVESGVVLCIVCIEIVLSSRNIRVLIRTASQVRFDDFARQTSLAVAFTLLCLLFLLNKSAHILRLDPYCIVNCGGAKVKTNFIEKTLNPWCVLCRKISFRVFRLLTVLFASSKVE